MVLVWHFPPSSRLLLFWCNKLIIVSLERMEGMIRKYSSTANHRRRTAKAMGAMLWSTPVHTKRDDLVWNVKCEAPSAKRKRTHHDPTRSLLEKWRRRQAREFRGARAVLRRSWVMIKRTRRHQTLLQVCSKIDFYSHSLSTLVTLTFARIELCQFLLRMQ